MSAPHVPGLTDLRPLGHGGFATVYRARQAQLGREVAVKIGDRPLHDERDRRRFLREAHAAGRLSSHPHVVTVHDSGITADGRPFLVMELCKGTLADELTAGPLKAERVREIGVQLADAVATAHAQGILHRDIKPANVLVDAHGAVKLSDFGLAAILDGSADSTATRDALSPNYAAPEAFAMTAPTPQTDVYSLAATLYTLLANRPPREIPWPVKSFDHLAEILKSPVPTVPQASEQFMETLVHALEPDTERRTKSAEQFRDELKGKEAKRNRWPWIAAAVVALLVIAGTSGYFLLRGTEKSSAGLVECGDGMCLSEPACYQRVITIDGKRSAPRAPTCDEEHVWEAYSGGWLPPNAAELTLKEIQALPEPRKFCTERVMKERARKPVEFTAWAVLPLTKGKKPYFHCIAGPGKNVTSKGSVFTG
ncbi:serine/threonine protein kinase [Lentzea alba]|uniref:serine/threonine-protein kinase n=1 Tax=Lentzea alba TaxID=2714351 RepID=UPI0039BFC233